MEQHIRIDGRFPKELRRIQIEHKVINGSGIITLAQGLTKVKIALCKLKPKGQLNIALSFNDTSRSDQISDRQLYVFQSKLTEIFTTVIACQHQVNIDASIIQDDGSVLSVLINAISLCLCYHGIPMIDMCISVTLNDMYDLCSKEQNKSFVATVVYLVNSDRLIYFKSAGRCQKGPLKQALLDGIASCKSICEYFSHYLVDDVGKSPYQT
ncbi:exosome complex component RRP41 [Pancytospora epiphaga]|nr:exosome complex component RRP41 [Pancytospora epiphaga]